MNLQKTIFSTLLAAILFGSCSEEETISDVPLGKYDNGILVLTEGNFGGGNANVTYLSNDFATFENGIFAGANPTKTMGDTAQDIGFYNDLAFIVLNGSNKIEVVNRYTFKSVATITAGLNNPRFIAFANGKGFVTNWGNGSSTSDDFVAVLNVANYNITSTIPVAEGPERIIADGAKLYVAHKGGFGFGKTVSVINAATNALSTTINVGDVPNSLLINKGSLYVLCGGKPNFATAETAGSLFKINTANETVTSSIVFSNLAHPSNLAMDNDVLYYTVNSGIFKMPVTATTLPATPFFSTVAQGVYGIYSFAVKNNSIFVGDAGDFNSNGKLYVYSNLGTLNKTFTVGIIPTGIYFN